MNYKDLWVEKQRPTTVDRLLLSDEMKVFLQNVALEKNIPHLLFVGPPGTGKTTTAKIIVKSILQAEYIYINASDQNSVDTVRGLITNFIQTKSMDGRMKIVILDEFDGMSGVASNGSSAQQALRNIMEEYSAYARFILTCNYIHKVIEPIRSRVQEFYFQPTYQDFLKRCVEVLKSESVVLEADQVENFKNTTKVYYPDLRKCLNILQQCSITGKFIYNDSIRGETYIIAHQCLEYLYKNVDINELRKYVIDNESKFNRDYHALLKEFFEILYNSKMETIKSDLLCTVAEGMAQHNLVIDKEINFIATCLKIGKLLAKVATTQEYKG